MSIANESLENWVRALPKTETHLHLEGSLPYALLHTWQPDRFPEDPAFRRADFRFSTFSEFNDTLLAHAVPWFTTAERYHEAAKVIFDGHVANNVRYVETSFHLPITGFIGVPGREIIAAIRAAVPPGLEVGIFAGMLRTDIGGELRPVIDQLHTWDELAGVDLHGHEDLPTHPDTAKVWRRLRDAGKITKCHAGEFGGPAKVREAIEQLGVTRIQHGIQAVDDPTVVRLAAERAVTFDVCPISNVRLRVVPAMSAHPLRQLMNAGVRCTVSTDDPLIFANTINDEYLALAEELRFTRNELKQVARNGWAVASVGESMRQAMLAEIERFDE